MESMGINYWAVLVAGVAYMVLGAIWYTPALFGNAWLKAIGKTKEQVAAGFSPLNYLWALITSLVAAYGIARVLIWRGTHSLEGGIIVGLLAGVCFVMTSMGVNDIFENRSKGLTIMNVLYHLVGFVIIGIIIGVWR